MLRGQRASTDTVTLLRGMRWWALAVVGFALAALMAAPASRAATAHAADTSATALPIYGNSDSFDPKYTTIVINGTNLPVAPTADIGQQTGDSKVVDVYDDGNSNWLSPKWHAGYGGANCQVTIGASTSTQMILAVGDIGPLCTRLDTVTKGDNITITLYNADGSQATQFTQPVVAPNGNTPTVNDVNPPFGPEAGGQGTTANGQVLVSTSGLSSPEAFWFGGVGLFTAFYGVATTNFTRVPNTNNYMVTPPPSLYGGVVSNFGVSVMDADEAGTSQEACTAISFGCNDEYFYLHPVSQADIVSPPIQASLSETVGSSTDEGGGVCGPNGTPGVQGSLSISALATSGPITLGAKFGESVANGLPEADQGFDGLILSSPIQISVSVSGGLQGCVEIPFPVPLNFPGLGGLYFAIGGSISGNATITVTVAKGTYGDTGGSIPGDQADDKAASGSVETENCVDPNTNMATNQCITTAVQGSVTGTVTVSPVWLQLGPSNGLFTAQVAAGVSAAATGTITYPPFGITGDICLAGDYAYAFGIPKLSLFHRGNGDLLGPYSFVGDASMCPLSFNGAVAAPLAALTGAGSTAGRRAMTAVVPDDVAKPQTASAPAITGVSPVGEPDESGNTNVTITGTGFTAATGVDFGSTPATDVTVVNDTSITATSPPGVGVVDVTVTTPVGTSATSTSDLFAYAPPPEPIVTAVSPSDGTPDGGTPVTITGTNFSGATQVDFDGQPATSLTVVSSTEITAVSPADDGDDTVDVQVETPNGVSAENAPADSFNYTMDTEPAPVISSVSPTTGPIDGGDLVTITGTDFTGATEVDFGDEPATSATVVSDTEIKAVAPANTAQTLDITVSTPTGDSDTTTADQFTYSTTAVGPTISGVSPNSGDIGGGTPVTITGAGLTGASAVTFDGTPAVSFSVTSDTTITAVAPPGVDVVDVQVTADDADSPVHAADEFTYTENAGPPTVSGVSPGGGAPAGGTAVQIAGANFTGATQVAFCGTPATSFTVVSATSITAVAPAGSGQCDVTVTVDPTDPAATSQTSAADQFTYGMVPGAPTIGTATAGNGQATVTFAAPAPIGGSPVTSYTITAAPGGQTATGTASPLTVTGLTNGTTYTFTVTATNAIGSGPASASSNSVTPSAPALAAATVTGATPGSNLAATVSLPAVAVPGATPLPHPTPTLSVTGGGRRGAGQIEMTGTAGPGQSVRLYAQGYGQAAYHTLRAPVIASASGAFAFEHVKIARSTRYKVAAAGVYSAAATAVITDVVTEVLTGRRGAVTVKLRTDPSVVGVKVTLERVNADGSLTKLTSDTITAPDGVITDTVPIKRSSVTIEAVVVGGDGSAGGTSPENTVTVKHSRI